MRRPMFLAIVAAFALAPGALRAADAVNPDLLAGLSARSIGPAAMSGRVADVDVVESNPDIMYIGTATGGVWKTVNGGLTWDPIFDDQPVHSIGAVAVFQPNPDVVWVGSGEGNVRNSVSIGNGVYRSLDGGKTWSHLGLEKTERIHRVVLHPTDPNVAWVAALGQLWGENPERGVFKTTDGGKTWRKVLYVDDKTGAADLMIDPSNPNKLFAAMWQFRRWPWIFNSGGPGSGLHVSHDGGETWKRITEDDGLPKGNLGRIGLAISRSNPSIVYALVENADKSQILRSADGGQTWKKVSEDTRATERPFYYADLKVDPVWPNRVYSLTARLLVSEDSAQDFDNLGRSREIHGDYHDLWINPRDPEHIVAANDGGLGISRDRGETWMFVANLPLAQFYHVAVDMDRPYNVYGGLQDNGSWRGPSSLFEQGGGIRNSRWDVVGGGDGFDTRPDPEDSMAGYSMSQGGELTRWNLQTREFKSIKPPEVAPGDKSRERLRFNWNAGLAQDPFEPGTIYYGSQYVHKSTDRGDSWTIISPDLTTDNAEWQQQSKSGGLTLDVTAAENHTTIIAIAPSALQKGVLWVGTDDGRLHVTRDGGQTWTSVEKNVKGVPDNTWIPHITPSRHDAASAFVVFDNHRRSDFAPYVYRTDDWGKTWKSLATKDLRGYALSVEQDPVDKDLLFLGTEFGLWASLDGGARWMKWKHGVPTASVMDMVIHPRDHDLVLGTHGRAVYVIDDISPLRDLSAETMAKPVHVHPIPPAVMYRALRSRGVRGGGAGEYQGENRDYGALITFSLNAPNLPLPDKEQERARKEAERAAERARAQSVVTQQSGVIKEDAPASEAAPQPEEEGRRGGKGPQAEIKISDASGKVIRTIKTDVHRGLNRVVWDLGRDDFRSPPSEGRGFPRDGSGPSVRPGTYTVAVKYGKEEARSTVEVKADQDLAGNDWQAWDAEVNRVGQLQNAVVEAIERVAATKADVDVVLSKLDARAKARTRGGESGGEDPDKDLKKAAKDLQKRLGEVERKLWVPPATKGIVEDRTAQNRMGLMRRFVGSSWTAPTGTAKAHLDNAEAEVREVLAEVNKLYAEDVPAFRQKVAAAQIDLLGAQGPIEVK